MPIVCLIPLSILMAAGWKQPASPIPERVERTGLVA